MRNPYTLLFGKTPLTFLPRESLKAEVIEEFTNELINEQAYIIVGLRGSGKTVFMTDIANTLGELSEWIVVDLNAERNLLDDFVSALLSRQKIKSLIQAAKIDLSYMGLGVGVEVSKDERLKNAETVALNLLKTLKKNNYRVLVTIDEISNSQPIREFVHSFQSFIRADLPVFLLATGIFQNIRDLEEDKGNTFFARAPRIEMAPLKIRSVAESYKETLKISDQSAYEMAQLTKGYSFAFQVLGHYTWKSDGNYKKAMKPFEVKLFDAAYDKIWSELSKNDREFCYGIAKSENGRTAAIREAIGWDSNKIGPYRKRLNKRGLVNINDYGYVKFKLPLFDKYAIERYEDDLWL